MTTGEQLSNRSSLPRLITPVRTCSYLVIPDFYGAGAVQEMLDESKRLIEEFDLDSHPMVSCIAVLSQSSII